MTDFFNEEQEDGPMRLRLSIVYRPAGYRNDQDLWVNAPFKRDDLDDALNHALTAFAAEIQERMRYADLLRRGVKCEFRHSRIPGISLSPEEPIRRIARLHSLIQRLFPLRRE
jgi:hypothetical protein